MSREVVLQDIPCATCLRETEQSEQDGWRRCVECGTEHEVEPAAPPKEQPKAKATTTKSEPTAPAKQPPTGEPVVLAPLLDATAEFYCQHVILTGHQSDALALFTAHSHCIDAAETTPYMAITSAEKRCGKSLLLDVMALLVAGPLKTVNVSDAALFRSVSEDKPTLLFDEVDAILGPKARDREDLRGLLNSGYQRGQQALRMGGANKTTLERFDSFCPKVLAGIGKLPDTIADRAIHIRMKRKTRQEEVRRFRRRVVQPEAAKLKAQLEQLPGQHKDALEKAWPELPDELDDRAQDVWEPLLAIADLAGGDWPERARAAATALSTGGERDDDESRRVQLLAAVKRAFDGSGADRYFTRDLIRELAADDESPFAEWWDQRDDKPERGAPAKLAAMLKPFGIRSRSIWPAGEEGKKKSTAKGFHRDQFDDAFSRYLVHEAAGPAGPAGSASGAAERTRQAPGRHPAGGAPAPDGLPVGTPEAAGREAASGAAPAALPSPAGGETSEGEQAVLAEAEEVLKQTGGEWIDDPSDGGSGRKEERT